MDTLQKHKNRMSRLKKIKQSSHLKEIETDHSDNLFLSQPLDEQFLKQADMREVYSLHNIDYSITESEVQEFITELGNDASTDNILEPVFLSLFDGVGRAFNIGIKQGITASRLYQECKNFDYKSSKITTGIDSYTEYNIEVKNIHSFNTTSKYSKGKLTRDGESTTQMRDGNKMNEYKDEHFGKNNIAIDAYNNNESIYKNKRHAKSKNNADQAAEADHVLSCAEICNKLKANKAINPEDIKEIINSEDNLAITSKHNNRGSVVGKFDKSQQQLQKELDQGFVENKQGKKVQLSDKDRKSRQEMINKMEKAQQSVDRQVNDKVIDNIIKDSKTQKRLAGDALSSAGHMAIGEAVIILIKPLYFELKDCFQNGIEEGVGETSFKLALKKRLSRMKNYVLENAKTTLRGGVFNFFRNFLTMLLEGIVNCFVGVFKHIARMIKEGIKSLFQILPILRDSEKSASQKGDAILKLVVSSTTIFASIGIEAWLNSVGIAEPWSIILSSVLTAVITALMMYLLDKIDLFGVNKELKLKRVSEAIALKDKEVSEKFDNLILQLT